MNSPGTIYYPHSRMFDLCMTAIVTGSPLTICSVVDVLWFSRSQKHVQRRDGYQVQVARQQILHILGGGGDGGAQYLCTVGICDCYHIQENLVHRLPRDTYGLVREGRHVDQSWWLNH